MSEKVIKKEELVKIIRGMVKENLQKMKETSKPLKEASEKKVKKITTKELQEMVRESILEVLAEEKWMQKATNPKEKGEFTEKAGRHDMSVQEFADHVLAHTEDFPEETVNQAKFAKAAKSVAKSHK